MKSQWVLFAFVLLSCFSALAKDGQCDRILRDSMDEVSQETWNRCRDLEDRQAPMFVGFGSSYDPFPCISASKESRIQGKNKCVAYATEHGGGDRNCEEIAHIKIDHWFGYRCAYQSIYYYKGAPEAKLELNISKLLLQALEREAKEAGMGLRELIINKLEFGRIDS